VSTTPAFGSIERLRSFAAQAQRNHLEASSALVLTRFCAVTRRAA
jgi:hypothetical protein